MKHSKEEILKALHIIKDTCYESYEVKVGVSSCYKCPFSDLDGYCILAEQNPMSWDIKDDEQWRAFE